MALRYIWSKSELEKALAPAIVDGRHTIEFRNITEAKRFRMACYALRRRTNIGTGLSFILNSQELQILIIKTPKVELQ